MNNDSIPSLLHQVATKLDGHCNQILLERLGIGMSQFRILLVLQDRDARPQRDISASLCQTEASISRQVKLLREKGLIQIKKSAQNRREHLLFLTLKGDHQTDRATEILNDYLAQKFEALNEKEQAQLSTHLLSLANIL
jgi:DNA-binding MarR family transcriptional regulator